MQMTGNSGLISIGHGMNSRVSNAGRLETETVAVLVVDGDVGHGWLCLDLVGRMVQGGDGKPWVATFDLYF